MPPPIRYPLPTLVLLVVAALLAWRGEVLTRPLRASLSARWSRATEGPPVPSSDRPQVVAGPIVRKALLLHDDVAASERPGGPASETIRHRMFVEVFDTWPLKGAPTHYRVGNRRPIGWVAAADLIAWDTRLVVRAPEGVLPMSETPQGPARPEDVGAGSLPVLAWTGDAVQVAVWEPGHPWERVSRTGWVGLDAVRPARWGVLLDREELLALLRRAVEPPASSPPSILRLRAVLGRLSDARPLTDTDLTLARGALPPLVFNRVISSPGGAAEALARANEQWQPEATWGGLSFAFVPLTILP
jgi:hypothetical protein